MDNKIEQITLSDGRRAERHTTYSPDGKEIVEIFVEQKCPPKLEKRIILEKKEVVARETTETLRDGEVVDRVVREIEDAPLATVKEVPVKAASEVKVASESMNKDEILQLVTDGIVAALGSQKVDPAYEIGKMDDYKPQWSAQAIVEQNVKDKSKNQSLLTNVVLGVLIAANLGFLAYYVLVLM